jgi:hypothetical protein
MITPEQVWLAVEPVDMRMGIDGLSLRIQQLLGCSPCDGTAYAFCNRQGNRVKLVVWDGTGVWLCVRRLHHQRATGCRTGTFLRSSPRSATVCVPDLRNDHGSARCAGHN